MTILRGGVLPAGTVDGVVRDVRRLSRNDDLPAGAVVGLGDPASGPYVSLTIEGRIYPRKAPVHLHKSDTFRMALGEPIVVAGTTYRHGEFRLQGADTFYGPEIWTDEVGTNQLLVIADRRGAKPYLAAADQQAAVDRAFASDVELEGIDLLPRDAVVHHEIRSNVRARPRPGHWDGGFTDTTGWPALPDGTRLAVVALGDPARGPVLVGLDRPPGGAALPEWCTATDLLRLVVRGSDVGEGTERGPLGFRLARAGLPQHRSAPGEDGCQELWLLADRSSGLPRFAPTAEPAAAELARALTAELRAVVAGVAA